MWSRLKFFYFNKTNILDRYLIREFTGPFLLATGGFAIIAIVDILMYLVELLVISGIPFLTMIRLLIYKLPSLMVLFFPMAVLFAIMLLLVRMAKDNEITVLRVSGVHAIRIVIPLIAVCFMTTILSYYINENLVPWTNRTSDMIIQKEIKKKPPPNILENVVFKDSGNRFFYINKIDKKQSIIRKLLIFEDSPQYPRIITANEAVWKDHSWTLLDGRIIDLNKDGNLEFMDSFYEMKIHVNQSVGSLYTHQKNAREMNSEELRDKIRVRNKGGLSTRSLKVEYYMKFSVPLACFIFGLTGIAFCLNLVQTGKDWWGVIIAICASVLTVGLYFFLVAVCRAFGKEGSLDPFTAAWLPNIIYGGIGGLSTYYYCYFK